ncbi:glycoside hydrolase family 2 TIM barrel-domain containing protein [Thermophagus sp. OGC60D27]|uniref:glycoside hydrolase family 2 TIM barrel-domain containing protein n=1 Tax=Thermophagus sp. OGC60D27 TaxID=3458415 RepID=UPI004038006D
MKNYMQKKRNKSFRSILPALFLLLVSVACNQQNQPARIETLFDNGWKFQLGDVQGAQMPSFNDSAWRSLDLPHDWSIENLPNQEPGKVTGPFSKESIGTTATGYTIGGTAWYRKTFTLDDDDRFSQTIINFDGVYMNSEVWVNGKLAGTHPYGYTAFQFDITEYLNPAGKPNVIAVKVKNEGKNSRWYSGSGIYRHVWLIRKQPIHITHNGIFVNTESISENEANVTVSATVENSTNNVSDIQLKISIIDASGKIAITSETPVESLQTGSENITQSIKIQQAKLWSTEEPNLYTAEVKVIANEDITDHTQTTFGIRTIHFDAKTGFTLNGKTVLLKGGNLHHDNGFLGAATIDRAEERRVELMKANGFNAIRASHNPPSKQFLDACDRLGILVMDEAFDQWVRPKNPQDYHLYFREWWKKDLKSMIYRDRNHPSVIFWSIGNELNERADSLGYAIRKELVVETHKLDSTRPVTEGVCDFWDHPGREWSTAAPVFNDLDIAGYNYLQKQFEADHAEYPDRIIVSTESHAADAYAYWQGVEKNPYVIGDFVWTGMDHLGETGCGHSKIAGKPGPRVGLQPWPWFSNNCGDIDLCGNKKPQSYYRDVVWDNSKIEMMVHTPIPEGMVETYSYWGWPDEYPSWNWAGNEGKLMDVRVFTKSPMVRLELNGKVIGEQAIDTRTGITANFKVPYELGVLKAFALNKGKEVGSKELKTTGAQTKVKLKADRSEIKASRNDLSYISIEITDNQGNVIPDAKIPVTLRVSGVGEIAGSGNANPTDMESFNNPVCKTFRGKALAILRPLEDKKSGTITLMAEADSLETGEIAIKVQ